MLYLQLLEPNEHQKKILNSKCEYLMPLKSPSIALCMLNSISTCNSAKFKELKIYAHTLYICLREVIAYFESQFNISAGYCNGMFSTNYLSVY